MIKLKPSTEKERKKMDISKYVGNKIKEFRKEKRMTQKELGEKIGVKHNTISSYEHGTNDAELNMLYAMANVFDKSIDDFFPSVNVNIDKEINNDNKNPLEEVLNATLEKELSSEDLFLVKQITEKAQSLDKEERKKLMSNIKLAINIYDNSSD